MKVHVPHLALCFGGFLDTKFLAKELLNRVLNLQWTCPAQIWETLDGVNYRTQISPSRYRSRTKSVGSVLVELFWSNSESLRL